MVTANPRVARLPGLLVCCGLAAAGLLAQGLQQRLLAHPIVEALVVALLLGVLVRHGLGPRPAWKPGIDFSGKTLLELGILLLGGTLDLGRLLAIGWPLLLCVSGTVVAALLFSVALSRTVLHLPRKPAILIAVGNAICGNSAIATVAPLIGATAEEVASTIALTAVLGVCLVIGLPMAYPYLHLQEGQYGALVGLSVYAVPQVLAASYPVGTQASLMATLVKLARVLFLAPVALFFALRRPVASPASTATKRPRLFQLLPWFILGFLCSATLRTLQIIPTAAVPTLQLASRGLTVLAMAALGLSVDLRALRKTGGRTALAVLCSLALLFGISYALVRSLYVTP